MVHTTSCHYSGCQTRNTRILWICGLRCQQLLRIHDELCTTAVVDSVRHTAHEAQHTHGVVMLARDV